jgi:hypothetical protein
VTKPNSTGMGAAARPLLAGCNLRSHSRPARSLCEALRGGTPRERRLVCASNSGTRLYMCVCASPEFSYERMRARAALINTREFPMAANIDRRAPQ